MIVNKFIDKIKINFVEYLKRNNVDRKTIRQFFIWPITRKKTSDIFSEIYRLKLWGSDNKLEFYSGLGSELSLSREYSEFICEFIKNTFRESEFVKVVDLGCGDFRVGQELLGKNHQGNISYIGVDVVPELIERNQNSFGKGDTVNFICADISEDNLPAGDVCLIREVLQHLSNQQISKILDKVKNYKYCFITEMWPQTDEFIPNKNIYPGAGTRSLLGSAVVLDKPPFNCSKVENVLTLRNKYGARIITFQIN